MNARAYFNNLLPATREHAAAADRSGDLSALIDGYRPGDPLVASELSFDFIVADADVTDLVAEEIASQVWRAMNSDDRPNGPRERSLSVGDVVRVGDRWLACKPVGWVAIDEPGNRVTDEARIVVGVT